MAVVTLLGVYPVSLLIGLRALATPAEAAAGAELVHCLGIDRELPHLAGDAAPDTLVQTVAELTAKGQAVNI